MNKLDLQLFAETEPTEPTPAEPKPAEPKPTEPKPAEPQAKYTDEDVDRILGQKFAEWQKKQEKKTSEAERLAKMTAEEKAAERMKALEDKLKEYETNATKAEMTKQARALLQGENIHVGDELVSKLIADDAESTKESVEAFVKLFNSAVEAKVKEALKSEPPKAGGKPAGGMTKEQILAVTNTAERQRLIRENMELFQ